LLLLADTPRAVKQAGKDNIDRYALVSVFISLFLADIFQQCQGTYGQGGARSKPKVKQR
jgi:hypothetical protein